MILWLYYCLELHFLVLWFMDVCINTNRFTLTVILFGVCISGMIRTILARELVVLHCLSGYGPLIYTNFNSIVYHELIA